MSQIAIVNNALKGIGKKIKKAFYNPYQKIELSWTEEKPSRIQS